LKQPVPRLALVLVCAALILHGLPLALTLADPDRAFTAGDSRDWDLLARNLVQRGVYTRSAEPPFDPEVFRAPGYPVFVAVVYGATGFSLPALLVVQAVLAAGATALVYVAGRQFGLSNRMAGLAAFVSLCLPISTIFWATLASENLFVVFMLAAFALAWSLASPPAGRAGYANRWRPYAVAVLAGACAGLMSLTRPIGVLLLPVVAIALIWPSLGMVPHSLKTISFGQAGLRLALAAVGFSAALGPWWWRNDRLFGRPVISTVGNINLLTYNAAAVLARRQGLGFWDGRYLMWEYWDAYYASLPVKPTNELEDADAMRRAALDIIWQNPIEFAWVNTIESLNSLRPGIAQLTVFFQPGVFDEAAPEGDISPAAETLSEPFTRVLTFSLTGLYGVAYALTLAGAAWAVVRRRWALLLGVALPVGILLLSPGPVANSRFRVPAEPLMAILIAVGLQYLWTMVGRQRHDERNVRRET
jgi:hypothetical protein